jgi:hypothetical protein
MFDQIAYAITASGQGSQQGFGMFVPLIILGLPFAFLLKSIARRKGRNQWGWFAGAFVPVFNFYGAIWLASLQDAAISDMREALEALVEVLVQKGMVTKDEVVAEFEKLDRKMKESRGKS